MTTNAFINSTISVEEPILHSPLHVFDLPKISMRECIATNILYCSLSSVFNSLKWCWCYIQEKNIQYWLTFKTGNEYIVIAIHHDIVGLDTQLLEWSELQEQSQLIGWSIQHEPIIQILQIATHKDWILDKISWTKPQHSEKDSHTQEDTIRVGFTINHSGGHFITEGIAILTIEQVEYINSAQEVGQKIPGQLIERTKNSLSTDANGFSINAGSDFNNIAASIKTCLPWSIDTILISRDELQVLRKGSVIRLDNTTLNEINSRVVITVGDKQWLGAIDDLRIKIIAPNYSNCSVKNLEAIDLQKTNPEEVKTMNDSNLDFSSLEPDESNPSNPGTSYLDSKISTKDISVQLRFEAGQLQLPFSKLNDIQAGYIFELDKKLEDRFITVYANESAIARGQLVCVGDLIGVRITDINI